MGCLFNWKKSFYFTPYERPDWFDTYWAKEVTNLTSFEDFDIFYNKKQDLKKGSTFNNNIKKFSKALSDEAYRDYPKIKKIKFGYIFNVIKYFTKNLLCKYFNFCLYRNGKFMIGLKL